MTTTLTPWLRAGATAAITLGMLAAAPAQAALLSYQIALDIDSGPLAGQSFAGLLSYDDAQAPGSNAFGDATYTLASFSFSFAGTTYGANDVANGTTLSWVLPAAGGAGSLEGVFDGFAFIPGDGVFDPFFSYDFGGARAGNGTLQYTPASTVPEPAGAALLATALLALAALQHARRRDR